MKLWSKEALVLGGVYGVLSTPLAYLKLENADVVVSILFILCLIALCVNKTPKFIDKIMKNYPKMAYYLASIGWIPYFVIISMVSFFGFGSFIEYSDSTIQVLVKFFVWILNLGVPISLVVAFVRQRLNKV